MYILDKGRLGECNNQYQLPEELSPEKGIIFFLGGSRRQN
jgi:hypothetical protein